MTKKPKRPMIRTAYINPNAAFDQAFEAARSEGCDFFVWRGGEYHTKTRDEMKRTTTPIIMKIEETDQ